MIEIIPALIFGDFIAENGIVILIQYQSLLFWVSLSKPRKMKQIYKLY